MKDSEHLVYGERAGDLRIGIQRVIGAARREADGHHHWRGDLTDPEGLPLLRAVYRAEAEVLLEEAAVLGLPQALARTEVQRRMTAFARIAEAMHGDAPSGGRGESV